MQVFDRFVSEEWDTTLLSAFLHGQQLLGEGGRVPCCEYPASYAPT